MSFDQYQRADRRLRILQALAREPDYSINEMVLRAEIKRFGHGVSHDCLRGDLAWLAEQQLISTATVGTDITVASISRRGCDVAAGAAHAPGVNKPQPSL